MAPEYGDFTYAAYQEQSEFEMQYCHFRDEFDSVGRLSNKRSNLRYFDFHGQDGTVGILFEALLDHPTQYMSFSQRKFIGFRQRYEFDQKRILLASQRRITLLGYHPQSEKPFEILNCPIPGLQCNNGDEDSISACLDDIEDEDVPRRVQQQRE